jgi:hypothetical protein
MQPVFYFGPLSCLPWISLEKLSEFLLSACIPSLIISAYSESLEKDFSRSGNFFKASLCISII